MGLEYSHMLNSQNRWLDFVFTNIANAKYMYNKEQLFKTRQEIRMKNCLRVF